MMLSEFIEMLQGFSPDRTVKIGVHSFAVDDVKPEVRESQMGDTGEEVLIIYPENYRSSYRPSIEDVLNSL